MRVLFDLVHPADVLFFKKPMEKLAARGDRVIIASRYKDVTCDLLDRFGQEHVPISTAGEGHLGLALELLKRDFGIYRMARQHRPHVMIGFGGVAIAHIGNLLRIPAISFYAADTAKLQTRITWPFIHHLYVPEAYAGAIPEGRTSRFKGVKELSYFHPDNFAVDDQAARENGWEDHRPNFFVRTVSWRANHDIGKSGWSDDDLRTLITSLSTYGKVHLSTERELPEDLRQYQYRGAKEKVHHVIAKCDLYVGESATMAHEASFLGVPAIYDGPDHPGTTRELAAAGMLIALRQPGIEKLLATVHEWRGTAMQKAVIKNASTYFADRPNLAQYIVDAIDQHSLADAG